MGVRGWRVNTQLVHAILVERGRWKGERKRRRDEGGRKGEGRGKEGGRR